MFSITMPWHCEDVWLRALRLTFLVLFLMLFLMLRTAFAQSATATPVDLSIWLQLIIAISAIVVPSAIGLIAAWLKIHFKLQADSAAAQTIDLAVTAFTQLASAEIARAPTTLPPLQVKSAAIANALNQMSAGTAAAMKLRGVTAETIAQRIDGALTLAFNPSPPAAVALPAAAKA